MDLVCLYLPLHALLFNRLWIFLNYLLSDLPMCGHLLVPSGSLCRLWDGFRSCFGYLSLRSIWINAGVNLPMFSSPEREPGQNPFFSSFFPFPWFYRTFWFNSNIVSDWRVMESLHWGHIFIFKHLSLISYFKHLQLSSLTYLWTILYIINITYHSNNKIVQSTFDILCVDRNYVTTYIFILKYLDFMSSFTHCKIFSSIYD